MVKKMPSGSGIALFWDESFLWGLMAYKALRAAGLPFELVNSDDIRKGRLRVRKMLFVPGGWASNKLKALGNEGVDEIRKFVAGGGNYLGICGGAGLATADGIGLLDIKRLPTKQRVPSFSGRIRLNINKHPIWGGLSENDLLSDESSNNPSFIFHAWWPSQFLIGSNEIRMLATFGDALPDSFSSDLNVGDVNAEGDWSRLEKLYHINLNPERLLDEPAVVEGTFGKGRIILSLVHFDTLNDTNGAAVLRDIRRYFGSRDLNSQPLTLQNSNIREDRAMNRTDIPDPVSDMDAAVTDLISLGVRNFLWFWRNPMLLQWRRGVRGLEYCTLYVMIKEIAEILRNSNELSVTSNGSIEKRLVRIEGMLLPFVEKAKRLLLLERYALQDDHITYERCDDPEIQGIRAGLFSRSKSYGGLFKELIDEIDRLLFLLIR